MPGFDKSKFKNLTKNESEQLICGICLEILRNPYITKCCGQAYCRDCIEECIAIVKTCPNDRKSLSVNDLSPPPLLVKNMLNSLEIYCKYKNYGCVDVKTVEFIEIHEKECKFNPEAICFDCFTINGESSEHNCIDNLKIKLNDMKQKYDDINKEYNLFKIESAKEITITKQNMDIEFIIKMNNEQVIRKLKSELLESQNENDKLNLSIKQTNNICEDLENQIKNLSLSYMKVIQENTLFQSQFEELSLSNMEIVKENTLIKEQFKKQKKDLHSKIKQPGSGQVNYIQCSIISLIILSTQIKIEKLEADLVNCQEKNENLTKNLIKSNIRSEKINIKYSKCLKYRDAIKNDNDTLKEELKKEANNTIESNKKIENLSQNLTEKNNTQEIMVTQVKKLEEKILDKERENKSLKQTITKLNTSIKNSEKSYKISLSEIKNFTQVNESLKPQSIIAECSKCLQSSNSLKQDKDTLEELRRKENNAIEKIEELNENLREKKAKQEILVTKVKKLENKILDCESEYKNLKSTINKLNTYNKNLKKDHKNSLLKNDKLISQNKKFAQVNESLKAQSIKNLTSILEHFDTVNELRDYTQVLKADNIKILENKKKFERNNGSWQWNYSDCIECSLKFINKLDTDLGVLDDLCKWFEYIRNLHLSNQDF